MKIFYDFVVCSMATLFFAILFRTPKNAMLTASIMGGLGYVVYDIFNIWLSLMYGYFFGTLFISIFAEVTARLNKMPAVIFITPAVIPLVPGVGLYHTMRYFVNGKLNLGMENCVETLACAGVMAVAIALPPMMIHVWHGRKNSSKV